MSVVLVAMPMFADDDKMITREELPNKAQMFLDKNFAKVEVLYVKAEYERGLIDSYDVVLNDAVEIEFNKRGEWKSVDCKNGKVPNSVLPKGVIDYVKKKFAKAYVVEIEREKNGYDVKLNNDLDLEFDLEGKFLRID